MAGSVSGAYASESKNKGINMLYYAVVFFIVAVIAAFLGFAALAGLAAGIAKILFFVFLVFFVIALLGGRTPRS
jgi:uncharacterized membrane protein YtjA (UPF0391 family)